MAAPEFRIATGRPDLYTAQNVPGGAMGNSGIDVRFVRDVIIPAGHCKTIDLEIKVRCVGEDGYLPFLLLPRSSVGKLPIEIESNLPPNSFLRADESSVGAIRHDRCDSLLVSVRNHSGAAWTCRAGDAYLQLATIDLTPATLKVVGPDDDSVVWTLAGDGGFGSTSDFGVKADSTNIRSGAYRRRKTRWSYNLFENTTSNIVNYIIHALKPALNDGECSRMQDTLARIAAEARPELHGEYIRHMIDAISKFVAAANETMGFAVFKPWPISADGKNIGPVDVCDEIADATRDEEHLEHLEILLLSDIAVLDDRYAQAEGDIDGCTYAIQELEVEKALTKADVAKHAVGVYSTAYYALDECQCKILKAKAKHAKCFFATAAISAKRAKAEAKRDIAADNIKAVRVKLFISLMSALIEQLRPSLSAFIGEGTQQDLPAEPLAE